MHIHPSRIAAILVCSAAIVALPGCSWFVLGGVAMGFYAFQETNSSPAVIIETPDRLLASPGSISYTLYDPNDDECSITVEFSLNGAPYLPATGGAGGDGASGLQASSGGTHHAFSWDFAQDTSGVEPHVKVRITVRDEGGSRSSGESGFFDLGNVPPAIESIALPAGVITGTATIKCTISDTKSDPVRIQVQFNRDAAGGTWVDATPKDPIAAYNLASAPFPGLEHLFPWDSNATGNLASENGLVRIRIRASDDGGTIWGNWLEASGTIAVRNDILTRVEIGSVNAVLDGLVYIPFTVTGNGSQQVSILCEYRLFGVTEWKRATAGPGTGALALTAAVGGTKSVFAWDSRRDGVRSGNVTVRLAPSEEHYTGIAATANFAIGNNASDAVHAGAPMPTGRRSACCVSAGGKVYAIGAYDGSAHVAIVEEYDPALDTWTVMTPMPTARSRLSGAVVGGKVYAVGGWNGSSYLSVVEVYDPALDTWASRTSMSATRGRLAVASARGKIYAVGGFDGSSPVALVEEYDPETDNWVAKTPMGGPRQRLACATVGEKIYAVGGDNGGAGLALVEVYDTVMDGWTARTGMPTPRNGLCCASLGGKIYAAGGSGAGGYETSIEEYDPLADTWAVKTDLSTGRGFLSCAVAGGKMYVVGGFEGAFDLAVVEVYSPPSDAWNTKTPMSTARGYVAVANAGGKIYAMGGWDGSAYYTATEEYDPSAAAWAVKASMPTARGFFASASVEGKIYAVGGKSGSTAFLDTVECYDPVADAWTAKAALPVVSERLACAAVGGKIYAFGGDDGSFSHDALHAYDPGSDTWAAKSPMPSARYGLAAAVVGGKIYAVGGRDAVDFLAVVEIYDPSADTWAAGAPMPTAREYLSCAAVGGRIYAIGGWNGNLLDTAEVYDPASDTWASITSMPWSRGGEGCATFGGRIFVIGGYDGISYLPLVEEFFASGISLIRTLEPLASGASGSKLVAVSGQVVLTGGETSASSATTTNEAFPLHGDIPLNENAPFTIHPLWTAKGSMGAARRGAGGFEYNGRVHVVGGFDATGTALASMEMYDPVPDAWTALTDTLPTARGGLGVLCLGDRMVAFGGDTGSGNKTGVLEVYNLQTGSWEAGPFPSMGTARSHFGFAAFEGRIHVFGGEGAGGAPLDTNERFDPSSNAWAGLNNLPVPLEGCLCLFESGCLKLFGGEIQHPTASMVMTDRILVYDHDLDRWRVEDAILPYPARDLFGCTVRHAWPHRGNAQSGEFCLIGGGFDGTSQRQGFFRFYSR